MASSPPAPDHSSRKARGRKASTKSALTRKVILDGAAELFAERGYKLTTLNDIAEKIGVHLTGLYYYYDNKEQLASDVIASSAVTIREALDAAIAELPEGATALAKIEVAVDVYLECVLGPAHLMRAAARITSQISPEMRSQALTGIRENNQLWFGLIDAAIAEGTIRPDLDPKLMQMTMLGAMNWTIEWFDPSLGPTAPLATTLKTMFLDGIKLRG